MESLKDKIRKILHETDACFAHTKEQMDECDKFCTGHGCPIWEVTLNEIMKLIDDSKNER